MVAIVLHLYYQDLWEEFKSKIVPLLNESVHLYITVNDDSDYIKDMKLYAKEVIVLKNKGMDFGPFVYMWNKIKDSNYEYVVKLHGKKSVTATQRIGRNFGAVWRTELVDAIIRDKDTFEHIVEYMNDNPTIYMAGSIKHFFDYIKEPKNHINRLVALHSIEKLLAQVNSQEHGYFVGGSIFLVRTEYLKKFFGDCDLIELYEQFEDYYSDVGSLLAHGFERVIGYGVETHGGKYLML